MAYQIMMPNSLQLITLFQQLKISNERIMQFQLELANETWESVYIDNDNNSKFDSFLHTLNVFEASFPVKYESIHRNKNGWITQGIKLSCESKRGL
jgi:hypothetical protein